MQQHQQQLRQQQQLMAGAGGSAPESGPVSPSLMVTASAVCEMSDKLSDLKLDQQQQQEEEVSRRRHSEEHPFSVGECPRCAVAQQPGVASEEKILNTTPGSETKGE